MNAPIRRACLAVALLGLCAGIASAGSVYTDARYQSLTADRRSLDVGQSITVLIYEQASAETRADTDTDTSLSLAGELANEVTRHEGRVGARSGFEGGGAIGRSARLVASVSVTITDVHPGGELQVAGEQSIELNDEVQHISISGRLRPQDVSAQNTVPSSRLADARITYVGDGVLGDGQAPGIITKFFNWLF